MTENDRMLKKMSIGDILDYSIELYKRNFKKLFILSLILYIPFIIIYTAVISYMTGDLYRSAGINFISGTFSETPDTTQAMYNFIAYFAVILLMGLLYLAFSITLQPVLDASITQIIYNDAVYGKSIEWKDAIRKSFRYFGRLFLNRLLYGLIIYGIMMAAVFIFYIVIFLVILVLAGTSFSSLQGSSISLLQGILISVIVIAGFAGLFILIGYFAMRFGLGTQSVIIENVSASRAISRSHELTAKKFWHSGLTVGIAAVMVMALPSVAASAVYFLAFFDKGLYTLANSAVQVITSIVQPFVTVVLTMVFIDLKVRKEGLDLEARVDEILESERKRNEILTAGDTADA